MGGPEVRCALELDVNSSRRGSLGGRQSSSWALAKPGSQPVGQIGQSALAAEPTNLGHDKANLPGVLIRRLQECEATCAVAVDSFYLPPPDGIAVMMSETSETNPVIPRTADGGRRRMASRPGPHVACDGLRPPFIHMAHALGRGQGACRSRGKREAAASPPPHVYSRSAHTSIYVYVCMYVSTT